MKLLIKVTREVILESIHCPVVDYKTMEKLTNEKYKKIMDNLAANCMISVAVRDIFPDALVITNYELDRYVGSIYPFGDRTDTSTEMYLPQIALDAIAIFDISSPEERKKMKPFEFTVELKDAILARISLSDLAQVLMKSKTVDLVY